MIIPKDAIIAEEKIRDYLLKPLEAGDKSHFLNRAGYTRQEWWELLRDLREQILPAEGVLQRRTRFGERYEVKSMLLGPNGKSLRVRTFGRIIVFKDGSSSLLFPTHHAHNEV